MTEDEKNKLRDELIALEQEYKDKLRLWHKAKVEQGGETWKTYMSSIIRGSSTPGPGA